MDSSPAGLTEKQEQALQRMERLTALRRSGRSLWRSEGGERFVAQLLSPRFAIYLLAWSIYWTYFKSTIPISSGFVIFAAAYAVLSFAFSFIIAPMKRRIEALERSLEEEIKRNS
jgi:hypothetical protein